MKNPNRILLLLVVLMAINSFTAAVMRPDRKSTAHEIAELARSIGLQESDPIIQRAKEIWYEETDKYDVDYYSGVIDVYDEETEEYAVMLAKLVYGESRGIKSQTHQACIIWTVLNRLDSEDWPNDIKKLLKQPHQFHYVASLPTVDDYGRDLVQLARDVIFRYKAEKSGVEDVGRVLPSDYIFYTGNGRENYFRNADGDIWDYTYTSPYYS